MREREKKTRHPLENLFFSTRWCGGLQFALTLNRIEVELKL